MTAENFRNIRLGAFILIGTVLLVIALYIIGNKQNIFGSTFRLSAQFQDVNGLMKGNNVRFGGIDIGTVESVEIISDTSVNVIMVIEDDLLQYIKKNTLASVGTDGLMGNKLVNLISSKEDAEMVEDGDVLKSLKPLEMDEMMRTLNVTNENIQVISGNLRTITDKINSKNNLWSVLMDTVVADNVKSSLVNIRLMSNQAVSITGNLKGITDGIKKGKGTIGALITDTTLSSRINQTIVKLEMFSDTAAIISGDISGLVKDLKQGKGSMGVLLNDTSLVHNLNTSIKNIESAAGNFDQNMEALKYSWPFKKYYKKQKKTNSKK